MMKGLNGSDALRRENGEKPAEKVDFHIHDETLSASFAQGFLFLQISQACVLTVAKACEQSEPQ